jgi:hypothetical protein
MPDRPRREPQFSHPNLHITSPTAPNYMIFGDLEFFQQKYIIAKEME